MDIEHAPDTSGISFSNNAANYQIIKHSLTRANHQISDIFHIMHVYGITASVYVCMMASFAVLFSCTLALFI